MQLPKDQRALIFYSEGKNYWPHLERLVREMLATSEIPVCYISSGKDDPGLFIEHPNYQTFKIDEGYVRNWLFENIDTDVMVMTMPDLHQYQVKRSKHQNHYIYVQHSLASLHMIYRKGAFDHYDTIFCAGPHHLREIRAMEEKYNLPFKNLVKHGYGRLDSLIEESKKRYKKRKVEGDPLHILIAPSWGAKGIIESGIGEKIIGRLIAEGCKVTLRPHPQTMISSKYRVVDILKKYGEEKMFSYEANVAGQESLHESDVMISDWSGAALEYALGLNKPVFFIDVPKKVNNEYYEELNIEPFEVFIRDDFGTVIRFENITDINSFTNVSPNNITISEHVFGVGCSSAIGCDYIKSLFHEK